MPIKISIDRNIINVLNEELLNKKFLPAVNQKKIIVHLSDTFLWEILLDDNIARRVRHSDVSRKLFNGHLMLPLINVFRSELKKQKNLFYDQIAERKIRQLFDNIARGKQLNSFEETKRQEALKSKKAYDEYLKIGQEVNLKIIFRRIKEAIMLGLFNKEQQRFDFEQYYDICSKDQKLSKLQKFLEANGIIYEGDSSVCIDNGEYPCINLWLRSWYVYHYYTVQKKWTTLRKNDATDLMYIVSAYCVDHFITNDNMLIAVGNICYNSVDKFITWDNFESRFLVEIEET